MFVVCLFDFADRAVFAVLAQTIKVELRLSDFQLGLLQGLAFAFLYALLGLPLARFAEHASRLKIISACTAFWSVATLWCGFAQGFIQLAVGRIGVGIGEAGFLPAANSLVGDRFPRSRRASTMGLIMLGTPAGILTGALIGGHVAEIASWRHAFFVLGVPGLVTALLVVLLLKEPARGLMDSGSTKKTPAPDFPAFLKALRAKPALMFIIAGGAMAGFGNTSISQFLAVFLARVHDMDVRETAAYYGMISATFLTIGLLVGSFGTDWLARRDARWPAWGGAIGLSMAPLIYFVAFNTQNITAATGLLILAGSFLMIFYAPTSGMIQNLLNPRMRATGIAIFAMLYTLVGSGLGPTFIGFVSDVMSAIAYNGDFAVDCPGGVARDLSDHALVSACHVATSLGIKRALMVAVCVFFVASLFYYLASRTLREDFYSPEKDDSASQGVN
ncbi:spinster family MFS transporter [Hyphococcus luteus]|uniref:MFS transporter n=1 Tax=Hyphococcus luteus TaxID=2058213 RepID=A0A2S7K545_9PROT|nr:MFS transporter [Marinicaulis flavus]PQA87601.1 MFS transporter [Marinicaulis flavus]